MFKPGARMLLEHGTNRKLHLTVRFNTELKAKYEALRVAGKPPKLALTAMMRKLLILANALLRDRRTRAPRLA